MRGQASDLGSNWFVDAQSEFHPRLSRRAAEGDAGRHATGRAQSIWSRKISRSSRSIREALWPRKRPRRWRSPRARFRNSNFSNGLRLLVREDPRLPLVSMVAVFRGGLARGNAGDQRHHASDGEGAAQGHEDPHRRANRRYDRSRRRRHRQRRGQQQLQHLARCDAARSATRRRSALRYPAQRDACRKKRSRAKRKSSSPESTKKKSTSRPWRAIFCATAFSPSIPTRSAAKARPNSVATLTQAGSARVSRSISRRAERRHLRFRKRQGRGGERDFRAGARGDASRASSR